MSNKDIVLLTVLFITALFLLKMRYQFNYDCKKLGGVYIENSLGRFCAKPEILNMGIKNGK
jgi:hypothetical protein